MLAAVVHSCLWLSACIIFVEIVCGGGVPLAREAGCLPNSQVEERGNPLQIFLNLKIQNKNICLLKLFFTSYLVVINFF